MNQNSLFYNGNKLMSLRDKTNKVPGIYLCIGNRSSGKTTYFNSRLLRLFKKKKYRKIGILYRYKYELEDAASQFFDPISFRFPDYSFTQGKINQRGYVPIYLDGNIFGYGICINSADNLKKVSNIFNEVDVLLWDEFQSADNNYCSNEIEKFTRIYTSIARCAGHMRRDVPVIMISNFISLLNPIFFELGLTSILRPETKFLRGNGYVIEQNLNLEAVEAINQSSFSVALNEKISTKIEYINDNLTNIGKLKGKNSYVCSIKYGDSYYAIRRFFDENCLYCSKSVDFSHKKRYTNDANSIGTMWTMAPSIETLRKYYNRGKIYYSCLEAKEAIIDLIHY